jgi:hypothetical protein
MREYVKLHKFTPEARALVDKAVQIVTGFQARGHRMTLRQLYYQLVTRNIIRNEEKQYKRLSSILSDARLMGLLDWSAIEDRIRRPQVPLEFKDLDHRIQVALDNYRLPRWADQPRYCELWVEKDALSGVLAPLASEYHVNLMVNRGYSSQSAMYDASKRFLEAAFGEDKVPYVSLEDYFQRMEDPADKKKGKGCTEIFLLDRDKLPKQKKELYLLYLGDHDPSGEDMVRDIEERLGMFGCELVVKKLALTMDQVEEHKPPPNPAKMTDPRAAEYVDKHGATSWEVDALPPDVLDDTIRQELDEIVDRELMDAVVEQEEKDKALLRDAVKSLRKKKDKK